MKKTFKRVVALCVCLSMLAGFAGCGKKDPVVPLAPVGPSEAELTAVREGLIVKNEIAGLGTIDKMELYVLGERVTDTEINMATDNKKIYWSGNVKRVVNYPDGYIVDIPTDWTPDYSLAEQRCRYDSDEVSFIASREDQAPGRYGGVKNYLSTMYQYVKSSAYHEANNITVVQETTTSTVDDNWTMEVYRLKLEGAAAGVKCYYTYVDYYNDAQKTYHFMFKCVDDRSFEDVYNSFNATSKKGTNVNSKTYECKENPNWNDATKAHYAKLRTQTTVDWGLFAYRLQTTGWKATIPMLEKRIEFKFPIISDYVHYGPAGDHGEFPLDFSNTCAADGRMMQVSYQYTENNNTDLAGKSPALDIYRRTEESTQVLTQFAQGAAQYGRTFYFRLNNEMNTDWTSYCGVANMLDPDIFVDSWIRLYDIFTETGANQYAIWVFNGFDNSYPPFNWCDYRCYFPDAQYVDMIGLTGYNFVTPEDTSTWRSFDAIYTDIENAYKPLFGDWPWIISEFGCESSTDPNQSKAQWITEMFDCFAAGKFPNIKVAIWFNCSDYANGVVTNDLNLEKDKAVYTAFKDGIAKTQP
ncbi:MAG: hypothetical protein IKV35_07275 [Clostridia bacterium]|nr:hypothetical protein [Clostridia bacterium]